MSRSNPNSSEKPQSPAVKFFEWSSTNKCLKYFDKNIPDKETGIMGTNVLVPIPFVFLVLDELSCVKGYRKRTKTSIWSNEVRDTTREIMYVKSIDSGAKSVVSEDSNIYQKLSVKDAKYVKSVYVAFFDTDKTWKLGNIQMKGSALGAWIEFTSPDKKSGKARPNLLTSAVKLNSSIYDNSGEVAFNKPVFVESKNVPQDVNDKATELDKVLQEYLPRYFAYIQEKEAKGDSAPNEEFTKPISNNEHWKQQAAATVQNTRSTQQAFEDTAAPVFGELNGEGDDLPF